MEIDPKDFTDLSLQELRDQAAARGGRQKKEVVTKADLGNWKAIPKALKDDDGINTPINVKSAAQRIYTPFSGKKPQCLNLSHDNAKRLLWEIMSRWEDSSGEKWEYNDSNTGVLSQMALYFTGNHECAWDLRKGIYLYGKTGRGKSKVMEFMRSFCDAIRFNTFAIVSVKRIGYDVMKEKAVDSLQGYFSGLYCFEDVGFEGDKSNVYGNEVKVFEIITDQRYINRAVTFVTSNVPPDYLKEYYDDRIVSRCREMFNFIKLDGPDYRVSQSK